MILNGVNSDEYVYLRLMKDTIIPNGHHVDLPAGTVVRFHIDTLRQNLWKYVVREKFFTQEFDSKTFTKTDDFYYLDVESNLEFSTTELMPTKQYKHVKAKRNFDIVLPIKYGDLLVMNDWLKSKLSENVPFVSGEFAFMNYRNVAHFNEDFFKNGIFLTSQSSRNKLVPLGIKSEVVQYNFSNDVNAKNSEGGKVICKDGDAICLQFREGEEINFSDPAVSLLFLDQEYVKFLLNAEIISEAEKEEYFIEDFSGWIPDVGRKYYRIHDCIKIKSFNDIMQEEVWEDIRRYAPDFNNIFYNNHCYSQYDDFDFDVNGYLRYVWTSGGIEIKHELSKIADPVSREIGEEHYSHEIIMKELLEEESELNRRAEAYFKSHKGRFYKLQRTNPTLNYVDFMIHEENQEKEIKKELVLRLTKAINVRIEKS